MKYAFTPLAVLMLLAFICTPVWGQSNSRGAVASTQAVIALTDPVSLTQTNLITQCTGPADAPFPAANSYALTLTTAKRLTIGETDCCCVGDYYQASINGNVFNTTPNPFGYCPEGTDPWGCNTGTCTPFSSGSTSACVAAGTYAVTITDPGFAGHSAAEIAAEGFCPAGFDDSFNTEPVSGCTCREVQLGVILAVPDESTFRNHGGYVSAATHALAAIGAPVSAECQSCIINQFARSVPQDQMVTCGTL